MSEIDDSEFGHNYIKLIPQSTVDIFTGKRKRDYSNEGKEFSKLYDLTEYRDTDIRNLHKSELTIPANTIMNLKIELVSPIIDENKK